MTLDPIGTLRFTKTDDDGRTTTAVVEVVEGPYSTPIVMVAPEMIDELMGLGGYIREAP